MINRIYYISVRGKKKYRKDTLKYTECKTKTWHQQLWTFSSRKCVGSSTQTLSPCIRTGLVPESDKEKKKSLILETGYIQKIIRQEPKTTQPKRLCSFESSNKTLYGKTTQRFWSGKTTQCCTGALS